MEESKDIKQEENFEVLTEEQLINELLKDEVDETEKTEESSSGYSQWSTIGNSYYPTFKTTNHIPAGSYTVKYDSNGNFFFNKLEINSDDIIVLPDKTTERVISDIRKFWDSAEKYYDLRLAHRKGIMLYGPSGTGKSYLIQILSYLLDKEYNGISILIDSNDTIYDFNKILSTIKDIENNRKIMIIIDNLDIILSDRGLSLAMLDILDGKGHSDNLLFVATTCFQERIDEIILSRPGRFSRWYEVGLPDENTREHYLKEKLPTITEKIELSKIVKDTEGFTIDYLRELVVSLEIMEYDYEDSIKELKDLQNTKNVTQIKNGKKIGPQFEKK